MSARILYSSGRIVFIQLILLFGFCALLTRLVYLQVYQDIFLDDQVFTRLDSQYSLLAPRGKILDRNDQILALDVKGYSVGIDLSKFVYEKDIILFLAEQLQKDSVELTNTLIGKSSGYKEISRNINFEAKERLQSKKYQAFILEKISEEVIPKKILLHMLLDLRILIDKVFKALN